jgi:hypothetical protein
VSHKLYIEMSQGKPLIYGEFDNNLVRINGTLNINNAYTFPTGDGTAGQVLVTNGSGNVVWVAPKAADNLGNHRATQNLQTNGNWISHDGDGEGVFISTNGNVGIGINNPQAKLQAEGTTITDRLGVGTNGVPTNGLLEVDGFITYPNLRARYYNSLGQNGTLTVNRNLSAYFSHQIAAQALQVFSDQRMKDIHGISDSKEDLELLMQIEITDYQMIDSVAEGNKTIKKVIAQQVREAYHQAVDTNMTRVVPDIYQLCAINNGWITWEGEVKARERIRLITEESADLYDVLETKKGAFKVDLEQEGQVFVYGREVHDFHTVDYEAISMLNVSATQELYKRLVKQRQEIESLKSKATKLESIEARLEQIEAGIGIGQTAGK